jgi:hypothetical protein
MKDNNMNKEISVWNKLVLRFTEAHLTLIAQQSTISIGGKQ